MIGAAFSVQFGAALATSAFDEVGPLGRARDFLWVALAGAGVALLGSPGVDIDPAGLAFAFGAAAGWAAYILFAKRMLAVGVAVAVLGSVLPFTLELGALRQLSAATFGILLSLEPAVAAFAGAVALGQAPTAVEAVAVVPVVVASTGASLSGRRVVPPDL